MTSQSSNSLRPVLCSHSLLFILRTNSSSLFSCTSLSRDQASLRLLAQKLVQVWNDEVRDQVKWTGPAQCVDGIAFEVAAQTGATSIRHVDKKQLLPRPHSLPHPQPHSHPLLSAALSCICRQDSRCFNIVLTRFLWGCLPSNQGPLGDFPHTYTTYTLIYTTPYKEGGVGGEGGLKILRRLAHSVERC